MQTAVQLMATALQIGAVYILFSLGLTLVFGVMRIVNFVHGQVFATAALTVAYALPTIAAAGLPPLAAYCVAAPVGVIAALVLSVAIYTFGFRYFQRDEIGSFILSIGLVLVLDGVLLKVFGGAVHRVPEVITGVVSSFGATVTLQSLVLCVVALLLATGLYLMLGHTKLGKVLRAVSIDHEAAMMVGIPYGKVAFGGFLIASLLAALAGVLIAPMSIVSPVIGTDYLIKGFIVVIIGGLGSIPGAILAGLFVATVETLGAFYLDSSYATIATFALVIAVLLVRPKGFLGRG